MYRQNKKNIKFFFILSIHDLSWKKHGGLYMWKMSKIALDVFIILSITSCSALFTDREYLEEMNQEDSMFRPNKDFIVVNGDNVEESVDWDDVWERTPMNASEKNLIKEKMRAGKNIKLSKNSRVKNKNVVEWAVQNEEIIVGMPKNAVERSWGYPVRVDVAGDPRFENERWAYNRHGTIQYVYFENGQVKGWAADE